MESSSSSSSVGDKEDVEKTTRGQEQSIEEEKNLALFEPTLPNRQCRICYACEEASGEDPILFLGCTCKGDISCGHRSCLKKWFWKQFQRNGNPHCEICRSPLGAHLKEIIWNFITAEVIQHSPQLLLLLQVSPEDLDHLKVPLKTPDFYLLPLETRHALEASFERLEQEQRHGQNRRREAFEMAQSIVANQEPSKALYEGVGYLARMRSEARREARLKARLENVFLNDFLELLEVNNTGDPTAIRMFIEHPLPHIYTLDPFEEEEFDSCAYLEGRVLRVNILDHEERRHLNPMEDLLDEVSMHAVRIVDSFGEDLILLPNYLDNLFLGMDERLTMSVSESHDNNKDIPIVIPVLNPNSSSSTHVFDEAARQTHSIPSRIHTYGRFKMFQLLQ